MPIWPFRRRRRASSKSAPAHCPAPRSATAAASIVRSHSRRNSKHVTRRAASEAQSPASEDGPDTCDKENELPLPHTSSEETAALPFQQRLERSPHLRPLDADKPAMLYNFRAHSMSQDSVPGHDTLTELQQSQTLRSKRSTIGYSTPTRRFSGRSRRRDDALREEEIRAMTAPLPIPKRPGDGPLRRDSKKFRGVTGDSHVSLPQEGSIHSSVSGVVEQRGWEVGSIAAVFSPRPAVRLSGLPQHVSSSLPPSSSGFLCRIDSLRVNDKAAASQDGRERRKRRTVGNEADEFDASDIRAIMERDAKRRAQRQQECQEKLARKLRAEAAGPDRADSRGQRRSSDERRRVEQAGVRVLPPTDVHPALRDTPPGPAGRGIEHESPSVPSDAAHTAAGRATPHDPAADAAEAPSPSPQPEHVATTPARAADEPAASPAEERHVLGTAQAVRLSHASPPPPSPIYGPRAASSASHLAGALQHGIKSQQSLADLTPPPRIPVARRSTDPLQDKHASTWASIFKRGGTFRRSVAGPKEPAQVSFSNTSRESMRNQALPVHLVGTELRRPGAYRSRSGTPVRTQSRFREDLPGMPISPPDSRTHSPDVAASPGAASPGAASPGAAVAFRSSGMATPLDIPAKKQKDVDGDVFMGNRNDHPLSQNLQGHRQMSASLASIDSEGSWLASGSLKRQSHQSALSKTFGKRDADFTASYEELGVDNDAEYLTRNSSAHGCGLNSPEEESEEEVQPDPSTREPFTVHASIRRQPTLVERDPRLKSRRGLVQGLAVQEATATPSERSLAGEQGEDSDLEPESPRPQIKRATSVRTSGRHSRQFSSGSAKLLDVPRHRASFDVSRDVSRNVSRENTPSPQPPPLHESPKDE